ncbi:hypothetical protein C4E44_09400 [Pseudomonas sp. MWU12-2312b]|uniref:hypothetical protein n=1 Tax=Pseudomonas moorei TaxID=395599 RepID=UPI000D485A55|nr:hypothetical protein [Pseudomonas moorei]PPA04373.1 hypothetical protein C4E44_09400 [Pseudomonas sp. MWU12-2312b]
MSLLQSIWPYIDGFLRIAPGIVLLPLTFFLGWKKVGHKVHISYSTAHERISASRIGNVVITNLKDKPLTVHEVHAMIDRHYVLPVQKFKTPVIVKGLESFAFDTDSVSHYYLGVEEYEPDSLLGQKVEFYLTTQDGLVKCKVANPPSIQSYSKFKDYVVASAHTRKYNDIVYNDKAVYALIYNHDGQSHTAIIEDGGFIITGWPFLPNQLSQQDMASKDSVKAALMGSEIKYIIKDTELFVHKLR